MAQQKKPPTPLPFEQHSSSSHDEEEEVSGGEEEATRAEEEVEQEVESSDDEEEDSKPDSSSEEDEEEVTPLAPVQSPKVRQQPAPGTKRPREESKAVSKKNKKRGAEEVVTKVGDSPKSKLFQRVFSEDDEVAMLNALLDYSATKCIDPIEDFTDFHDFVKKYIHADVTRSQLSGKIKKMKSKYKTNAIKKKETFAKAHDKSCYDISEKIWGTGCGGSELNTTRKGKRIPKMKNMTPGLQIPQVQVVEEPVREDISLSELAKTRDVVGMMCLTEDTFKQGVELLGDEARAALEDKWKNMVTAELELNYKKLELSRELMKLVGKNR
ncbi:unnamed protein product [Rhodiola kirilowii]